MRAVPIPRCLWQAKPYLKRAIGIIIIIISTAWIYIYIVCSNQNSYNCLAWPIWASLDFFRKKWICQSICFLLYHSCLPRGITIRHSYAFVYHCCSPSWCVDVVVTSPQGRNRDNQFNAIIVAPFVIFDNKLYKLTNQELDQKLVFHFSELLISPAVPHVYHPVGGQVDECSCCVLVCVCVQKTRNSCVQSRQPYDGTHAQSCHTVCCC